MAHKVVFVTTGFDKVTNGPGVYSQHLWNIFSDDQDIEFHLIAIDSIIKNSNIHTLANHPKGFGSAVYAAIEELAAKVIHKLGAETILHVNMAHIISPKFARENRSIVQVNDTEVCTWKPSLANLMRHGLRRNAALCWRKQRERAVVRNAGRTICNSHHTAQSIRKIYEMDSSRVGMIYKAIDLAPFNHAAESNCAQNDACAPYQIIFVGSNWRRKGLDVLLHAIASLKQSRRPIHLQVYGAPTQAMLSESTALSKKLGINPLVTFAGEIEREKLPLVLAASDMLAIPSHEEALGLVAIEALAAGIPVVASNIGGLPEIITTETSGLLVPPGDISALANAITKVLNYPNDNLARKSRQRTVEQFGVPPLENEIRKLYSCVGNW